MPDCPSCGDPYQEGQRFCEECGTPLGSAEPTPPIPAPAPAPRPVEEPRRGSYLHVDAESLDALLGELASKEGGPRVSFEGGRIRFRQGDLDLSLEPFAAGPGDLDARVVVGHGRLGSLGVRMERVRLDEAGLDVDLRLDRPK